MFNLKSSKKAIEALVVLLGVLIVVVAYFFGYLSLQEKTNALQAENRTLKARADAYEYLFTKATDYQKQTKEFAAAEEGITAKFLYGLSETDQIIYLSNMEYKVPTLVIKYFNMGEYSTEEYMPEATLDPVLVAGNVQAAAIIDDGVALRSYPLDYGFEVDYSGFKKMINYLNTIGGAKHIESLSLAFNNATGMLSGAISLNQYVLTGTSNQYVPLDIPNVSTGIDNIFGTIDLSQAVTLEPELATEETNATGE